MIRGTKRALVPKSDTQAHEKNSIDVSLAANLHNRWDVEVVDAATGEVKQRARGYNVICDGWWSTIPNGGSISYIEYGRGSGTPAATDTSLFSRIGYKSVSTTQDTSTLSQGFISWQYSVQLAPADAVGETITEVGLSGNSVLLTHAMLQDMNGNPISITKTATDIVNIYATVFLHIVTDRYANGKIRLTTQSGWMRGFSSGTNSSIRVAPYQSRSTGGRSGYSGVTASNYDATTKTKSMTFGQLAVDSGNADGGDLFIAFGSGLHEYYSDSRRAYLIMFPAAKSQITNEAIGTGDGTTQNFKTKFAFPTDATVYVDGVAQQTGVTVVPDHPALNANLDRFLLPIAYVTNHGLVLFYDFVNSNSSGNGIDAGAEMLYEKAVDGLVMDWIVLSGATAAGNVTIWASDDLETWTDVGSTMSSSQWWTIPAPYNSAKYYKIRNNKSSFIQLYGGARSGYDGYAIRFDTAPANGAVITADYKTPMIPKDDNHLMDVSMTVTFGEYTGEEI